MDTAFGTVVNTFLECLDLATKYKCPLNNAVQFVHMLLCIE